MWINTRDEARFGLLFLRKGRWKNRQMLSEKWVKDATTPSKTNPQYGYLWWLNADRKQWPSAPESSFAALGHGANTIWIDPEHDLVIVWRWHAGSADGFIQRVLAALKPSGNGTDTESNP